MVFKLFEDCAVLTTDNEHFITLDSFCQFLRSKHKGTDKLKEIRGHNIKREIAAHKNGLKEVNGVVIFKLTSVLRYLFHHFDDLEICNELCLSVSNSVFHFNQNYNTVQEDSILEIYKDVAKQNFKNSQVLSTFIDEDIDSLVSLPIVYDHYKTDFTSEEWAKICYFEHHFCKHFAEENYEISLKNRRQFLKECIELSTVSQNLQQETKKVIRERALRKLANEEDESIEIVAKQNHRVTALELHLTQHIQNLYPDIISHIVIINHLTTKVDNNVDVYLELADHEVQESEPICDVIQHLLTYKHNIECRQVLFLMPDTLDAFKRNHGHIARFSFRDAVQQNKLNDSIVFSHRFPAGSSDLSVRDNQKCEFCYSSDLPAPLTIKNFDALKEWHIDVPINVQILFEAFLNYDTIRRTKNPTKYIKGKIERLYETYDVLLNTFSNKHVGLLQQANTDELIMHYRNVNTLFSITSSSGATTSLNTAEEHLRQQADTDLRYYETYIKEHSFQYETDTGATESSVSLQQCHMVVMLDNLVRLKYNNDPVPGESRSKQLCTLPITLRGLPKNSHMITNWHDQTQCDGTINCFCKQPKNITKDDIQSTHISLSTEEQQAKAKFKKLCTWGYPEIWSLLERDELQKFYRENEQCSTIQTDELENQQLMQLQGEGETADRDRENQNCVIDSIVEDEECYDHETDNDDTDEYGSSEEENENYLSAEDMKDVNPEVSFDCLNESLSKNFENEALSNVDEDLNIEDLLLEAEIEEIDPIVMESDLKDDSFLNDSQMDGISKLEQSIGQMSLSENFDDHQIEDSNKETADEISQRETCHLESFGFNKFEAPRLLCKHPPPAVGRDDDISKLKEILDDILIKLGYSDDKFQPQDRILIGTDNKIATNIIKLMAQNKKYQIFLPEFPLLHLRKSKIVTLFSAYRNAGLLKLLQFMRGKDQQEWTKLISADHIDIATRNVRRLAVAFQLAFLCSFMKSLDSETQGKFLQDINYPDVNMCNKWNQRFNMFMQTSAKKNATFSLHRDMMVHCCEVIAIHLAERLGGPEGYNLLLAAVKSSLPFTFLNGASSYAPFCTHLLIEHYRAGHFHSCLKQNLFSTSWKTSKKNFALDTQWEMDHQEAHKSIRSGSTINAVTCRMSLVDTLAEVHEIRKAERQDLESNSNDNLGWTLTQNDLEHILRTCHLIVRCGGVSVHEDEVPYNIYAKEKTMLDIEILDEFSRDVGIYLIKRYFVKESLVGADESFLPDIDTVTGPKKLLQRVKLSKGVTIRRSNKKSNISQKTEKDKRELKRKQVVKRETRKIDCLTSEMNACQAFIKPDCSKPKVQKAAGMPKALSNLLTEACKSEQVSENVEKLIMIGQKEIPTNIRTKIQIVAVEFAGVKFKANAKSGQEYVEIVEKNILTPTIYQMPNLEKVVICEEKYTFTPDTFKAATRDQRKTNEKESIAHLKTADEMLTHSIFDKEALVTTKIGKEVISTYLAENIQQLQLRKNLEIYIDSELYMEGCTCNKGQAGCKCQIYSIPVKSTFDKDTGLISVEKCMHFKQRKGEAEMAQMDWLAEWSDIIKQEMAVASAVTSGDIDAITIHLFTVSRIWPRLENGKFLHPVYVLLHKPNKKVDIYNITGILETLETFYQDRSIGVKIAMGLCMGGNDFIPKFHSISHDKMLKETVKPEFRMQLFDITDQTVSINIPIYTEIVKSLYCPKFLLKKTGAELSFENIRHVTIYGKGNHKTENVKCRDPRQWLPPKSALEHVAQLIDLQAEYLLTAGSSDKPLPNFLGKDCLKVNENGEVEYFFGPESHIDLASDVLVEKETAMKQKMKRKKDDTPQKGQRYKILHSSTPKKK